jgi:predicted Zn-ribbon and HTH transcriptional regulator
MTTFQTNITQTRECDQCGYNLHGLPDGGKCPECGTSIRKKPLQSKGTMSDEAPTRFVRKLQIGFLLASSAIMLSILGSFLLGLVLPSSITPAIEKALQTALQLAIPLLWVGGIWLITLPRPDRGSIVPDKTLDNDRFRLILRASNCVWPIYILIQISVVSLNAAATPPSQALMIPLLGLMLLTGVLSWVSLIPTCIYFAEIGYWASHDHLAYRLRSTAWAMAVFGVLSVLLTAISFLGLPVSGAASFVSMFTIAFVILAVIVFLFTVIQLTSVMKWVIKHQKLSAGSMDRVRERIERDTIAPGKVHNHLTCDSCGYNLDGLPHGGNCPECGESYAEMTPMPVIDPARMHLDRDESEIELLDGDDKGIYFNEQLDALGKPKETGVPYTPAVDVPDDGDIPVSDMLKIPLSDEPTSTPGVEPNQAPNAQLDTDKIEFTEDDIDRNPREDLDDDPDEDLAPWRNE